VPGDIDIRLEALPDSTLPVALRLRRQRDSKLVFTILSAVAENERDRIRGRRELSRHRAGMGSRVRHREDRGEDHPAHPGAGLTSCIIIIAAADETANGPRLAPTPSVHPPQFVSSCLCHISRGLSPFIRHFLCRKFFRFCRLDQLSVGPAAAGVLWPMAGTEPPSRNGDFLARAALGQ
jgi:hypothetical protein